MKIDNLSKSFILPLFIFTLSSTLFYTVYSGWFSFLVVWVAMLLFSCVYLKNKFKERNVRIVFIISFCIYSLYMYITNYLYVEDPSREFFMMVDSMRFWNNSDYRMNSFQDFWSQYLRILPETIRYPLFSFINLLLSLFAQIIDQNNILVQKMQSVWLGSFSMPFIYLSFRKYFPQNKSLKYTIFFSIFSFVCIYSIVFNRDPHIYFLFTLGTYLLINYDRKKNVLLKLIVLLILIAGFRLEHGLFFVIYILSYFYFKSKKNKNILLMLVVFMPVSLIAISPILINKFQRNTEVYTERVENVDREEASAGAVFSRLPPGVKQVFMATNSQIAPAVPFWRGLFPDRQSKAYQKYSVAGYFTPWRFMESVAAVVWIYIWGFILYGFRKKMFKKVPLEIKFLFGISILLLLAASSIINVRRIYCVYPAMFILAMYFYTFISRRKRKKIIQNTTFVLIALYGIYIVFKGGI